MSAPVFLSPREVLSEGSRVWLDGPEGRHAATVRRLRVGEPVELTDGAGLLVRGDVVSVERDRVEVAVRDRVEVAEADPRVVVVQALPKGDRGERAVELMTEVGVDEVVPWAAARCVAAWHGERGARALDKWRGAAREAAKQARRPWLPAVTALADTAAVVDRVQHADLAIVLHESASVALSDLVVPPTGQVVLVVGPEGGLTDDELDRLVGGGAHTVRLGPTVMRTSTAGVVAAAVVLSMTARWTSAARD